jgi:predicted RNA-binding Zn-ribbon protein involved in translation (DUF1610 family)
MMLTERKTEKTLEKHIPLTCPRCGKIYTRYPALSRDGRTLLCPDCGIREALESIGSIGEDEIEHIVALINRQKDTQERV